MWSGSSCLMLLLARVVTCLLPWRWICFFCNSFPSFRLKGNFCKVLANLSPKRRQDENRITEPASPGV